VDRLLCFAEYSTVNVTPEEAARALRDVETSREAMRSAIQAYRGHLYLWLWGLIWITTSLLNWRDGTRFQVASGWLSMAGAAASVLIAVIQGNRVRNRVNGRFLGVCMAILLFGFVAWPIVLGPPRGYRSAFGLGTLVWMQVYVVAGLWFDNYLLWLGAAVTAVILAGFVFLPTWFWGCTLLAGLMLVGTGFYVRHAWR
jgi:hypothetical protein